MSSVPVGPGTRVRLEFAIRLASGELVDSTKDKAAEFEVGDGNLVAGFENALFGLRAGAKESITIPMEKGFGPREENNIRVMSRSEFPRNTDLSEGLLFSFADAQNTELPGVIVEIVEDEITVDFNHPLAGRDLIFEVEIHSVEQVSNEIFRS